MNVCQVETWYKHVDSNAILEFVYTLTSSLPDIVIAPNIIMNSMVNVVRINILDYSASDAGIYTMAEPYVEANGGPIYLLDPNDLESYVKVLSITMHNSPADNFIQQIKIVDAQS